jgi:hypothetical protein
MLPPPTRELVLHLLRQGTPLREVSRLLHLSRNTVRRMARAPEKPAPPEPAAGRLAVVRMARLCAGPGMTRHTNEPDFDFGPGDPATMQPPTDRPARVSGGEAVVAADHGPGPSSAG